MKKMKIAMLGILCAMLLVGCNKNDTPSTNTDTTPISNSETETWTVTLDLNYDGGGVYKTFDVERYAYGVSLKDKLNDVPTRNDGYTFEAWYHDSYCKVPWKINSDRIYADTTLFANWKLTEIETKKTSITWNQDPSFTYEMVDASSLPSIVDEGASISFRININANYEGVPLVKVNQSTLNANNGVYSFIAEGQSMSVSVTGLSKKPDDERIILNIFYTTPSWSPVVTNPKLYYWGTSSSGASFDNTIVWDDANDNQGAMTNITGNDYSIRIELNEGDQIEGLIVVMYQSGVKKQSQDIITIISESGDYQITYIDNWQPNSFGEYVFDATITKRQKGEEYEKGY